MRRSLVTTKWGAKINPLPRGSRLKKEPRPHWDIRICGYCGKTNKTGKRGRPIEVHRQAPKSLRDRVGCQSVPICKGCVRRLLS